MKTERLDHLVREQLQISPEEATGLIMAGRIYIGHIPADKPGMSVPADTVITKKEKARKYASRSGYKLQKALAVFGVDPTEKTVCDIGASNGGFTDCLLQHGAAHVFAVDVAYGILAWELRNDERVTVLERTNARNLTAEQLNSTVCDMVTADVSFISLTKIFPAINRVLSEDGVCITLIKPQFEAPRQALGKNGIVKDPSILPALFCSIFRSAAENGLYLKDLTVSPIHGTNGNVEYLALFSRKEQSDEIVWNAKIEQAITTVPDEDLTGGAE